MGLLEVWRGTYVTAKSASTYIDAENIISDANKIKHQLEELTNLARNVKNTGSELTPEVLSFDGTSMVETVDFTVQFVENNKVTQDGYLDEIIQNATNLYNEKQNEFNEQAQREDRRIYEQKHRTTTG